MITINELRDGVSKFGGGYLTDSGWSYLIDRLEAAERAVTEAYQRGYATGQEEIEKERDAHKAAYTECLAKTEWIQEGLNNGAISPKYLGWHRADVAADLLKVAEKERDDLRAKIERMERQEPHSYIYEYSNPLDGSPVWRNVPGYWNAQYPRSSKPLFALPGAQPAPSVPDVFRALVEEIVKEADDYEKRTGDTIVGWLPKARAALNAAPKQEGE